MTSPASHGTKSQSESKTRTPNNTIVGQKHKRTAKPLARSASVKKNIKTIQKCKETCEEYRRMILVGEKGMVRSWLELGEMLIALKAEIEDGEWDDALAELGFEEAHARLLMESARASDFFHSTGSDHLLPMDLDKLALLARLSSDQLWDLTEQVNLHELSRVEVSWHVNRLLGNTRVDAQRRTS